jgi:hypothetical protein
MFPPERIVCLSKETAETLYLLGEQDRIVDATGCAAGASCRGFAGSRRHLSVKSLAAQI